MGNFQEHQLTDTEKNCLCKKLKTMRKM